ncbi:hypothetical protein AIOGIFDO_00091 [Candidatus Methanoperedenaceae archaeon GB37]|nr:hypothetical protein AIOGIFDO_00091 [Candidatus Methanoperedenaceae archaeon GB37]CAD7777451.1 MAG: hypothetical protein KBONHNOK_01033 [Candidatus Methanoperedenaceae archaeon GB50]
MDSDERDPMSSTMHNGLSGFCFLMSSRKAIILSDLQESDSITASLPFKAIKPEINFDLLFLSLYLTIGVFMTLLLLGFSRIELSSRNPMIGFLTFDKQSSTLF